jgi:hypothetical protein
MITREELVEKIRKALAEREPYLPVANRVLRVCADTAIAALGQQGGVTRDEMGRTKSALEKVLVMISGISRQAINPAETKEFYNLFCEVKAIIGTLPDGAPAPLPDVEALAQWFYENTSESKYGCATLAKEVLAKYGAPPVGDAAERSPIHLPRTQAMLDEARVCGVKGGYLALVRCLVEELNIGISHALQTPRA